MLIKLPQKNRLSFIRWIESYAHFALPVAKRPITRWLTLAQAAAMLYMHPGELLLKSSESPIFHIVRDGKNTLVHPDSVLRHARSKGAMRVKRFAKKIYQKCLQANLKKS